MQKNNYTTAVNNFEAIVDFVEEEHSTLPDNLFEELRACIFVLKIQPQYVGLPDVPKQTSIGGSA